MLANNAETTVEDGRPFCPQCRAPQIHVQNCEFRRRSWSRNRDDPAGAPAVRVSSSSPIDQSPVLQPDVDRRIAVRAALKAGVLGFSSA